MTIEELKAKGIKYWPDNDGGLYYRQGSETHTVKEDAE